MIGEMVMCTDVNAGRVLRSKLETAINTLSTAEDAMMNPTRFTSALHASHDEVTLVACNLD